MAITINASTSSGLIQSADTSGQIELQTNGTTVATVNTSNNVKFKSSISVGDATPTTSGAGITFPATQSASSDANTLDDYEEGTWTPALSRTGSNYSYSLQAGSYIKIGNLVTCTFSLTVSSITTQGSGNDQMTGFPFTPKSQFSGNLRYTGSLSIRAPLTTATGLYYSGAFFFSDNSGVLANNFTTGDLYGVITYECA